MPRKVRSLGSLHEQIETVRGLGPAFAQVAELAAIGLAVSSLMGEMGYVKSRKRPNGVAAEAPATGLAAPEGV
jgi:hypothetical protein